MTTSDSSDEAESSADDSTDTHSIDFSAYNLPTDLTAFQVHLLWLIYRLGPAEGVNLQDPLEELYPEDINHGRLYPSLDRMVDSGLVNKRTKESDKRRKEYTLTGRGEWVAKEYRDFIDEMVRPDDS
ncbi:helix-turn-helix transcriptional regulator [Haladaptatus sp. DYSN1]|uniref:helix-turn-helix transcriptional regulator n=1 Tax=unclassified Haladaptatus TaxID=2622732 RepID=UPI00240767F7|nr:helix-turn-helix transcriptional regulator [Haladaptatus sp. DYSN1]